MPWNLVKRLTSCNSLQLLVFNLAQARSLPGIAYISEESTDIMKAGKSMNFFGHTLFNSFFCNPWTFPWRQMAVLEARDEAAYHGQVLEWLIMVTKVRHDTWNITESFCSSSCRTPRTCSRLTRRDSELGDTSSESPTYSALGVQETAELGKGWKRDRIRQMFWLHLAKHA